MKTAAVLGLWLVFVVGPIYIVIDWMHLRNHVLPEWLAGLILVCGILAWAFLHIRSEEAAGRRIREQREKESQQERELLRAKYEAQDIRKELDELRKSKAAS